MTDLRSLVARMADELDHSRQCLMDDRRLTHPLADEARAALAQPEPQPPAAGEVAELVAWLLCISKHFRHDGLGDEADRTCRAAELLQRLAPPPLIPVAIPGEEYHDDMGPVTWWRFPVEEPPWVGTPSDSDWPGYHTHFTPAPPEPIPATALSLPLPSGEGE